MTMHSMALTLEVRGNGRVNVDYPYLPREAGRYLGTVARCMGGRVFNQNAKEVQLNLLSLTCRAPIRSKTCSTAVDVLRT